MKPILTANPRGARLLAARVARLFLPKPRYKVSEYAAAHCYVPPGNAEPGKYNVDRIPYQRDMMDDAVDVEAIESIWVMAGQLGKTQCLTNIICYFVDYDPCGIMYCRPTIDAAKYFSKNDLAPVLRYTPALKHKVKATRSRDSGNTLLNKEYDGGAITLAGANSVSALRGPRKRVILLDEIDAYEPNSEGDPIAQADKRAETFHNAVKIKATTPTVKGLSRSEQLFEQSDKQYWHCECPRCGHWQTLKWSQVKFEFEEEPTSPLPPKPGSRAETSSAAPAEREKPAEPKKIRDTARAVYVCEAAACGAFLSDADRIEMILAGEWRATAPFRGIRGRHLSGLYRVLGKKGAYKSYLHEFAEEFLKAKKGGPFTLMVWTNTFLADWWEEARERIESTELLRRREDYTLAPEGVLILTAGIDLQGDRAEIDVVGWGTGEESWGLNHHIIPGNPHKPALYKEIKEWLTRFTIKNPAGIEFRITATCVDSGNFTDEVYQFAKPLFAERVFAIKGMSQRGQPIVGRLTRANRRRCPIYLIGTDTAKRQIYGRLRMTDMGPGYMHFSRAPDLGYDEDYFQQLTAEEVRIRHHKGFPLQEFVLPEGRRNEALDLRVYAGAALLILQPHWASLREKIGAGQAVSNEQTPARPTGQPMAEPSKEHSMTPKRSYRRPGGWVKGWK